MFVRIYGETTSFEDMRNVEKGSGRGIHFITNGWCLSAQAGWGNYCSEDPSRSKIKLTKETIRTDCEIAIWEESGGKMLTLGDDTVMGWVSWDMVIDIIIFLRNNKPLTKSQVQDEICRLKREYDKKEE